jgi:hypothetical protein
MFGLRAIHTAANPFESFLRVSQNVTILPLLTGYPILTPSVAQVACTFRSALGHVANESRILDGHI